MYINEIYEASANDYGVVSFYENQNTLPANMFREVPPESQEVFCFEEETLDFHKNSPLKSAKTLCAFCRAENASRATACHSCRAILTLSDLEMLLANSEVDREILRQSVERMETEKDTRAFSADELKTLAVGQINLKNLRQGLTYLRQASEMRPNDVILSSQVNALATRLAETEQHQSIHNSMPKGRTILVVDDSETVRNLVTARLEKSGHNVFCAADGIDALEKIKENLPDLVLLDVTMPRMDGYQVCKLIRGNRLTKDVPVVMISDKDGFFDKVRARMAGTTGYILKPFGPEKLLKTIETYIG